MNAVKKWFDEQKHGPNPKTQLEIAEALGIQRQYFNGILSGKITPGRKTALKMSEMTGIPVQDIMFGEGIAA